MRFAFKTSPQNTDWAPLLAVWREADTIDVFDSGWTFDHFYPIFADSTGPCLEGWITLTALAQATTRLRVGVLVTGIHYRHPAVLANMAAALDVVSGGRLELGIGAGWNEEESDAYGIELGSVRERFDRFENACEVLTALLRQRDHRLRRHLLPANGGAQRTQGAAARRVLASQCADIGRDPAEIATSAHVRLGAGDPARVLDEAAALGAEGLDLAIVYLPPPYDPAVLTPRAEAIGDSGLLTALSGGSG